MRRSLRSVSGMLGLLAITFSYAEAVIASTCAPMSAGAATTMMEPAPESTMDCPFGPDHGRPAEGSDAPTHCPFGAVMGQSCTAAPSLPAMVRAPSSPPGDAWAPARFRAIRPHLLLANAPFHPPRA